MQRRLGCGGAQVAQPEERAERLARLPVGANEGREPTPLGQGGPSAAQGEAHTRE